MEVEVSFWRGLERLKTDMHHKTTYGFCRLSVNDSDPIHKYEATLEASDDSV